MATTLMKIRIVIIAMKILGLPIIKVLGSTILVILLNRVKVMIIVGYLRGNLLQKYKGRSEDSLHMPKEKHRNCMINFMEKRIGKCDIMEYSSFFF